ncbi:MAG: isocitrate/isopropylmalate dehydrogenase family protein [Dehalococcoidia bacterium]
MLSIAVVPGDGISNEVIPTAVRVMQALDEVAGIGLRFEFFDYGSERYLRMGEAVPADAASLVKGMAKDFDAILFGAAGDDPRVPPEGTARRFLMALRRELDLFVNLRPCRLLDARLTPLKDKGEQDVNFVVFRENTEGLYSGLGGTFKKGTQDEIYVREEMNTWKGVHRVLCYAFDYARRSGLSRVTVAEKSGEEGIWLREFRNVARDYPDVEAESMHVDTLAYQMVLKPEHFKVIVAENMWGDILSDLAAALHGGRGLSASMCLNPETGCYFEPVHGTAPDIFGQGIANPFASVLCGQLLLEHFGYAQRGNLLQQAVREAIAAGKTTPDLGGRCNTSQVGDFLCQVVRSLAS